MSHKKVLIAVITAVSITGCATSGTAQQQSDACWSAGHTSALGAIALAPFKPLVCIPQDIALNRTQTSDQPQSRHTIISPVGTYQVYTAGSRTVITQTAKGR
jgi:hypothetical protein